MQTLRVATLTAMWIALTAGTAGAGLLLPGHTLVLSDRPGHQCMFPAISPL